MKTEPFAFSFLAYLTMVYKFDPALIISNSLLILRGAFLSFLALSRMISTSP